MLLTTTSAGCLALEEPPYVGELPVAVNHPPLILETLVQPKTRLMTLKNGVGCSDSFSVLVEDPDVDDRVTVRWYIDFDPVNNPSPYGRIIALENNGKAIRDTRAELNMVLASPGNPLGVVGDHLVEALVADRTFDNRGEPLSDDPSALPRFPTYAWFVRTEVGDCQ